MCELFIISIHNAKADLPFCSASHSKPNEVILTESTENVHEMCLFFPRK